MKNQKLETRNSRNKETEMISFNDLVEKLLHQPGFFEALKANPVKALKANGFKPTPPVIAALKALDYDAIQNVVIACDPAVGPIC
jgi:hypothetical protein